MFRRVTVPAVARLAAGARCVYTPPENLKKLYESDFPTQKYPIELVPSDSTLFAQFLFKAGEAGNNFDAISKDIQTISTAGKKLPIFWERNNEADTIAEFKGLNPATMFVMKWMQNNGMLANFNEVAVSYETLLNAQKKKHVAKIYVGDAKADTKNAKDIAKEMMKDTPFAAFSLECVTITEPSIASGFTVECAGKISNQAQGHEAKKVDEDSKDFTNIPAAPTFKTTWEDSVETEVLGRYFDNLAAYDAEEAKVGV